MELTVHLNDKIQIYSKTFLSYHHQEIINLLYQPLMGIEATTLYFTLWTLFNLDKKEFLISHRQLITFFNWSLEKLVQNRQKLEAIDLMNTFYDQKKGLYIYELKQPLSAKQYFLDSNLNIHLLYQVGDTLYDYLEQKFLIKPLDKSLLNVSKNFQDIYQIIDDVKMMGENKEYVTTTVNHFSLPLNYDFDWELLSIFLKRHFIDIDKMSLDIKKAIIKEAAMYQFDAQMMSSIILDSMKNDTIDLDLLHQTARAYYNRLKNKFATVVIKPTMTEQEFSSQFNKKRLTNKEKALKNYKTKSPIEYLSFLQGNTEVTSSMIEVVNELFNDYKLPSEVINVLIEFVRIRNDGRLPREYARTIASSWVFNKIKTAEEAMEMVEKIQAKEKEFAKRGEVAPTYRNKQVKRVVEVPAWMKEQKNEDQSNNNEEQVDITELTKLLESFK
ncbi:MAG TPA: DnaD domain protein [Haloplasmataceae bacterium]